MARDLLATSHALTVYNRTTSKVDGFIFCGAALVEIPCTTVTNIDVIFLIVGFLSDVCSTSLYPSTGALVSLGLGVVLVDMTTSDPILASKNATDMAVSPMMSLSMPPSLAVTIESIRVLRHGLALPGLVLMRQLYVLLLAHSEGSLDTQALISAFEQLNNTYLP
ncbi:hypothetical protein GUJ93_ZPchr0010g8516 [Zizania palustris]|uniref:6-phosphogluconate dehydrogenase NADP-binding domain-containing protein n=1 Tax=Zizania palustris TaxID=103762 RepID=A0A8J5W8N3_ZIZPA|nr:hypothetical protein GUJ93_ZPchr0010g8516 [Zizania palustris]